MASCPHLRNRILPDMALRILTMNLYNGAADSAGLAAALRDLEPDLVAVQELSQRGADVLSQWSTASLLDPRDDVRGMGMAARMPGEMRRAPFPNRDPVVGRFDGARWGLPDVELVNVHLTNPISTPLTVSRRLRRQEATALEDLLATRDDGVARVVVGDFNSSPLWPLYRRIAALATDGAVQAGTATRTWGYFPRSPRMLRIDHAFLQGGIRCTGTRLLQLAGADHRGLVIDLEPGAPAG